MIKMESADLVKVEFEASKPVVETFDKIWPKLLPHYSSRAEALQEMFNRFVGEYTIIPPEEPKTIRDLEKKIISIQLTINDKALADKMIKEERELFLTRKPE